MALGGKPKNPLAVKNLCVGSLWAKLEFLVGEILVVSAKAVR